MIHLKTILKPGQPYNEMNFAVLVEPDNIAVSSDKELYQAIHKHGRAVLAVNEPDDPFKYKSELETLSPLEFEQVWRGD